ncbi:MAG: hypothetical protein J5958_06585 [Clostridia bacterium]|nr:hypothetical protein [Clostridia bacterium]
MDDLFTPGVKKTAASALRAFVPTLIYVFAIVFAFVGAYASFQLTMQNIIAAVVFILLVFLMYGYEFQNHAKNGITKYSDQYDKEREKYETEREITVERDYTEIDKWVEKQMIADLESRRRRIVTPYMKYDVYLRDYLGKTRKEVLSKSASLPKRYQKALLKANRQTAKKCSSDFLLASNAKIGENVRDQKKYGAKLAWKTVSALLPKVVLSFIAASLYVVMYGDPREAILKLLAQLVSLTLTMISARNNADIYVQRETYLIQYKRELLHKFNTTTTEEPPIDQTQLLNSTRADMEVCDNKLREQPASQKSPFREDH